MTSPLRRIGRLAVPAVGVLAAVLIGTQDASAATAPAPSQHPTPPAKCVVPPPGKPGTPIPAPGKPVTGKGSGGNVIITKPGPGQPTGVCRCTVIIIDKTTGKQTQARPQPGKCNVCFVHVGDGGPGPVKPNSASSGGTLVTKPGGPFPAAGCPAPPVHPTPKS